MAAHGDRPGAHGLRGLADGRGDELRARPWRRPAGTRGHPDVLGFIPVVDGWQPDLGSRPDLRAFIAHGRNDPIMDVGFARRAAALLQAGGLETEYLESDAAHHIDPAHVAAAIDWLAVTLGLGAPAR